MVEWGGHHGGWGGFGPPSYIVKKCPGYNLLASLLQASSGRDTKNQFHIILTLQSTNEKFVGSSGIGTRIFGYLDRRSTYLAIESTGIGSESYPI